MADTNEKFEEIKKKVGQSGLYINRVPKKTRAQFVELAKEDFEGDYGFALKFLLDFHSGLLSNPNQMLMDQMELMTQEIESLKSTPEEKEKKAIRSVSGKVIAEKEK